jgi:hypothetical protein
MDSTLRALALGSSAAEAAAMSAPIVVPKLWDRVRLVGPVTRKRSKYSRREYVWAAGDTGVVRQIDDYSGMNGPIYVHVRMDKKRYGYDSLSFVEGGIRQIEVIQ